MTSATYSLSLALLPLLLACGAAGEGGSVQDTGTRVLDVTVEKLFSVGGAEAQEEWELFSGKIEVAIDGEGRLYVLDKIHDRVTAFTRSGEASTVLGRPGQGPGEFRMPMGIRAIGLDAVSIYDPGRSAFLHYSYNGDLLGDIRFEGMPTLGRAVPHPDGFLAPGRFFARGETASGGDGESVNLASESERAIREVHRAWRPSSTMISVGSGGGASLSEAPDAFQPPLLMAGLPDGTILLVDSVTYRIHRLSQGGEELGVITRPIRPLEVDEDLRRKVRQRLLAAAREGEKVTRIGDATTRRSAPSDEELEQAEAAIRSMAFPRQIPVIENLGVDGDGRIWVGRTSDPPGGIGPIDLLEPDGSYLGTITGGSMAFPSTFGPDGLIACVEEDQVDVPVATVFRITGLPDVQSGIPSPQRNLPSGGRLGSDLAGDAVRKNPTIP